MPQLYESNGTTFSYYYCCNIPEQINCALIIESKKLYSFLLTTVGTSNTCCPQEAYSLKIPPWMVKLQYIMPTFVEKMGSGKAITHQTWYVY